MHREKIAQLGVASGVRVVSGRRSFSCLCSKGLRKKDMRAQNEGYSLDVRSPSTEPLLASYPRQHGHEAFLTVCLQRQVETLYTHTKHKRRNRSAHRGLRLWGQTMKIVVRARDAVHKAACRAEMCKRERWGREEYSMLRNRPSIQYQVKGLLVAI